MSIIAGYWSAVRPDIAASCENMLSAMFARGAEDSSRWDAEDFSIGHKLVSTVPEDRYDRQPVSEPGGRFVVVADLRLDDRTGLGQELGVGTAELERLSDSALAARALERWDEGAFDRLIGVFAIAAWDVRQRRLLLARDILGHRPLFFHARPGQFAFASMPSGLHALPQIPKKPDMAAMEEFLGLIHPRSTRTYFEGVERVLPGHYCVVSGGRPTMTRYWRPRTAPLRLPRHEDYVEGLRHHLDMAVAAQLRGAGANVAAHLSAGLDSSAVAATAARQMALTGGRVTAFTACPREGYALPDFKRGLLDESEMAAATAALHPNMDHVLVRGGRKSALDDLDRTSSLYGQPMFNLCNLAWIDAINDAARQRGCRVMLIGFFGNASLSHAGLPALAETLARGDLAGWFGLGRALVRRRSMRWRGVMLNTLAPWLPVTLLSFLTSVTGRSDAPPERYTALRPERLDRLYAEAAAEPPETGQVFASVDPWGRPFRDGVTARLANLAGDTGAIDKGVLAWWGLDVRDPTADRRLVEFSLSVPTEQFIHGGEPKALIKHAMSDRLPAEVLGNPNKGFQGADWHEDLAAVRGRLEQEVERIGAVPQTRQLIDVDRLKALLRQWPDKGWEAPEVIADYRYSLLRAISAANFVRRTLGSNL